MSRLGGSSFASPPPPPGSDGGTPLEARFMRWTALASLALPSSVCAMNSWTRFRHCLVCPALVVDPLMIALHPGQPGVGPALSGPVMSSRYIFQSRVNGFPSAVCLCCTGRSSSGAVDECLREYAGMRLPIWPGTGCLGLPAKSRTRSIDHRSPSGFRITCATRNTPELVPTRCSAVRISNPSHIPSLQTSSYLPGMCCVFGILKWTTSANSASFAIGCLPLIRCMAVRPSGRTRHLEIRHAACRIIQPTILAFMWIFAAIRSSKADLSVRTCASTS